ncbi:MAG: arginase [Trueperaceae bacterium]
MTDVHLLGIPMDLGAGRRGVDMGPSALRLARLAPTLEALGHRVHDHGNVDVPVAEATADPGHVPYLATIAGVLQRTRDAVRALPEDGFPLLLGGDHSVTIGTVAGVAERGRTGLLWVDAHADLNTPETSPSGNVHGMPVAVLLGSGPDPLHAVGGGRVLRPEDVVYLGLRQTDPGERAWIRDAGIRAFTMSDVDRHGLAAVANEALEALKHLPHVHLSFDADVLDPELAPGVGTPVPGGLRYREAHLLMELAAASGRITSADLVEANPILDERNKTARILVEMAASLSGKSIL